MKFLIIIIIIFLVVIYVYTYIKLKKSRKNKIDAVGDFRKSYQKRKASPNLTKTDEYTNYLTKYNNSLDYIEKDAFLKEAAEADEKSKKKIPKPKKLHF
ncbi:MAG: hypothetical protein K2H52_11800 [Lachnospiraceae bacterium]|nr:hypothetical protein [Lachnospiraceae bacterium]